MTDIHIPPAALEAGARVVIQYRNSARSDAGIARATCLAILEAWPGMSQLRENDSASIREMAAIILPLPTENSDDQ